uniref:Protein TsetseEP domain-containing protein n=1 Tax=Anopheles dirus TaxID=7168 RepID=A0A182NJH0_9DIPT
MKYFAMFIPLAMATLAQYGETSPSPDFAVPARMAGVASGSLPGSSGNVVQNTNRVLAVLGQFQSITESLYGLQTPVLYRLATGFRVVMDSLVESGSPIFQALSNAARLSSGNITAVFDGIRRTINATVALNELHDAALNGTQALLGSGGVQNISTVLDQLVRNVANLSTVLDEIEPAIVRIQRLGRPTQTQVDSMYPRAGVRKLNGILLDYVNIGASTVPQINAVVNRIRLMDGFIGRLTAVAGAQRTALNSTTAAVNASVQSGVQLRLQNTLRAMRTNFNGTVLVVTRKLKLFFLDDVTAIRQVARNASATLTERLTNVTGSLDAVSNRTRVTVDGRASEWVMNRTNGVVMGLAWRTALAVTSGVPRADTCFARFNYEFDKIPRLIQGALAACGQEETRTLQSVANALAGYLGVVQAQLNAETKRYDQCVGGLVPDSSDALKRQRALCLRGAEQFSHQLGSYVVNDQLQAFEELLRHEVQYSAERHRECVRVSDRIMVAEVRNLERSIANCLN